MRRGAPRTRAPTTRIEVLAAAAFAAPLRDGALGRVGWTF
jgi:hypothetical protein